MNIGGSRLPFNGELERALIYHKSFSKICLHHQVFVTAAASTTPWDLLAPLLTERGTV